MTTDVRTALLDRRHVVVVNWRDLDHSLAGGSEVYAWEFARAMVEAGARVEFITARDRGQARQEVRDGIEIHRGGGAFTFYAYAAWSLLRRRRTLDAVVDPECGIPAFSPLFVSAATAVVLVVHHVHQEQFATYFPKPLALLGQLLERVAMPRIYRGRRTLAVSESTAVEMREQLGWSGPVDIVENGTSLPEADECNSTDTVTDTDPDRLLALGRLVPHKRVDLVLRTLADLGAVRPELRLDVAGKGPELQSLQALAAELGVTDRVTFHGFVDEQTKHDLLRRAALQVCASDIEGWGQVVVEAAGWGVPTVARDVPGLRESIRDGQTGWLVPDDPDLDLVGARLTAAVDAALRELSAPGSRRATFEATRSWAAGFSWTRMRREAQHVVHQEIAGVRPRPSTVRAHAHPTDPAHAPASTVPSGEPALSER